MLHVRAVHVVVERQLRKRMRLELDRIVGKADHVQRVARVLAADERVKRDGNLLGGEKAAAKKHRPAHVDHQDRRSLCLVLGAMDDEILRRDGDRDLRPFTDDRVEEGLLHLEQERVAVLVRLQFLGGVGADAAAPQLVLAHARLLELVEDVA